MLRGARGRRWPGPSPGTRPRRPLGAGLGLPRGPRLKPPGARVPFLPLATLRSSAPRWRSWRPASWCESAFTSQRSPHNARLVKAVKIHVKNAVLELRLPHFQCLTRLVGTNTRCSRRRRVPCVPDGGPESLRATEAAATSRSLEARAPEGCPVLFYRRLFQVAEHHRREKCLLGAKRGQLFLKFLRRDAAKQVLTDFI